MAAWPHGRMAAWPHGRMAAWPHGRMAAWPHGRMAAWPHGCTAAGGLRAKDDEPARDRVRAGGAAVEAATARLRYESRVAHAWHAGLPEGDAHAGRVEASVLVALDPRAVRLATAARGAPP